MRIELEVAGYDVQFLVVNKQDAESTQQKLIDKCAYPIFQDVAEVDAWRLHDGKKDDFYIFNENGELAVFLPNGGEISTNLSTQEGYENVKNAILGVLQGM